MKNISNNKIVIGVVGLILGLILGWLIGRDMPATESVRGTDVNVQDAKEGDTTSTMMPSGEMHDALSSSMTMSHESDSAILVNDQGAGSVVTVASVETDTSVWVTVREDNNGVVGNILGATRVDAGDSNNIVINLLRPTVAGKTYRIVLFKDDGDKKFDHKIDAPIVSGGVLVSQSFKTIAQ